LGVWFQKLYSVPEISDADIPAQPRPVADWRVEDWNAVLHKGMRRDEVQRIFGKPAMVMSGGGVESWWYGPGIIQFNYAPHAEYPTVYSWHAPNIIEYLQNSPASGQSSEKPKKKE
jgi:hypothetical protein